MGTYLFRVLPEHHDDLAESASLQMLLEDGHVRNHVQHLGAETDIRERAVLERMNPLLDDLFSQ